MSELLKHDLLGVGVVGYLGTLLFAAFVFFWSHKFKQEREQRQ